MESIVIIYVKNINIVFQEKRQTMNYFTISYNLINILHNEIENLLLILKNVIH